MVLPNDWEIKKCLWLSLAFPLAVVALAWLAASGIDIPVLTQIIGFIFLTFVPGFLILRILRVHRINGAEGLLYAAGLSLAFVMFTGLAANFLLPLIGIAEPISALPLAVTLLIFTLGLGGAAYLRDKDFTEVKTTPRRGPGKKLTLSYLLLLSLPVIAVVGAYLVNRFQNNWLLLFFLPFVGFVVALAAFDRLPRRTYPLAIVMIALSLMLHVSLISSQLNGGDIHVEYYFQNLVFQNGYWDYTLPHNYNTALSIIMLCPIYSPLLNTDAIWIFKIIYPLIFSLVPLGLFLIFSAQMGARKAFLATFFFMSMPMFISTTGGVRNQIGQLFFTLFILLLIDRKMGLKRKTILAIVFSLSLIVSHYALGYIFLAFLLGGWVITSLIGSGAGQRLWGWLTRRSGGLPRSLRPPGAFPHKTMAVIVGVYLVFTLVWYGGIAQGSALNDITRIGHGQVSLLSEELPKVVQPIETSEPVAMSQPGEPGEPSKSKEPDESKSKLLDLDEREALVGTALGVDFASASPLGKGFRIFQYLTEIFIVIGFLRIVFRPREYRFKAEHIALSIVAALILLACIVIPHFSSYLLVKRFYHISLFLLAPFCILGAEALWLGISKLIRAVSRRLKAGREASLPYYRGRSGPAFLRVFILAVLIPFFLFNTGFFFEVTGSERFAVNDSPSSMALSSYRLDMAVFAREDADAVLYLTRIIGDGVVYADQWGRLIIYDRILEPVGEITASGKAPDDAYIFLRTRNVEQQELFIRVFHSLPRYGIQMEFKHLRLDEIPSLLYGRELIYDNGGAQIWSPRE